MPFEKKTRLVAIADLKNDAFSSTHFVQADGTALCCLCYTFLLLRHHEVDDEAGGSPSRTCESRSACVVDVKWNVHVLHVYSLHKLPVHRT